MNKNVVKSLILQAMDFDPDSNPILYDSGGMILHVPDAEILVQIVVRECAKIADDNYNSGFAPVGSTILEHFGIKE